MFFNLIPNQLSKINAADLNLCKEIAHSKVTEKKRILKDIYFLWKKYHLGLVLIVLYQQQLNSGFILSNPLKYSGNLNKKTFYDPTTQIRFIVQWNPERALRKNHQLLIERGIIEKCIDEEKLIHKDLQGKPCYLCKKNIELQNPKEILLPLKLSGEEFYIGANFASITDNHFTIFHKKHRPQKYRKKIFSIMADFLNQTDGNFRIIYNGLAGASIEAHEHFQATSIRFPVESILYCNRDEVFNKEDLIIARPKYYLPLWIIEGKNTAELFRVLNYFILFWHSQNPEEHTENILAMKSGELFRFFIFLREKKRLEVKEKSGAMATFESSGLFVFSEFFKNTIKGKSKKDFFSALSLDIIKNMLKKIAPNEILEINNILEKLKRL